MKSWLIVFLGFLLTDFTHAGERLQSYLSLGKQRGVTGQILTELKGGLEGGGFRILETYEPAGDSQRKVVAFIHPRFLEVLPGFCMSAGYFSVWMYSAPVSKRNGGFRLNQIRTPPLISMISPVM